MCIQLPWLIYMYNLNIIELHIHLYTTESIYTQLSSSGISIYIQLNPSMLTWYEVVYPSIYNYGVASTSRLLQIRSLFRKRALWKRGFFAKETYNFKEPTNRSHPISSIWIQLSSSCTSIYIQLPWLLYTCNMTITELHMHLFTTKPIYIHLLWSCISICIHLNPSIYNHYRVVNTWIQ